MTHRPDRRIALRERSAVRVRARVRAREHTSRNKFRAAAAARANARAFASPRGLFSSRLLSNELPLATDAEGEMRSIAPLNIDERTAADRLSSVENSDRNI